MELLVVRAGARSAAAEASDGVRLHFVGDRGGLSEKCRPGWSQAESATAHNTRLVLNVCFNYGGRWDIAQAAQQLAERGEAMTEQSWTARWRWRMCPTPTC